MGTGEMSQYFCAHCGRPSSQQGHWMKADLANPDYPPCPNVPIDEHGFTFCCPKNHTCDGDPDTKEFKWPRSE